MTELFTILNRLRRPRLLIQAARAGCEEYRRDPHLYRLLGHGPLPRCDEALSRLIDIEGEMDRQRREHARSYSLVAHVDVLIAMMGEAQLARAYETPDPA